MEQACQPTHFALYSTGPLTQMSPCTGPGMEDTLAAAEVEQAQQQAHQQQPSLIGVAKHVLSEELLLYLDRARALVAGAGHPDMTYSMLLLPKVGCSATKASQLGTFEGCQVAQVRAWLPLGRQTQQ